MAQQFNITQSLFGFAPTDVQRQIDAERQAEALRLSQMSGPQSLVYRGAGIQQRQFADLSKGLLGIEDPRVMEANALERAKQAALPALQSGGQLAYLDALAGELERMGLTNQAVQARMLADQQRATAAEQQSQIALREAQAQKALQEQQPTIKTPASFAAVGQALLGIPGRPNLSDYSQEETALINQALDKKAIDEAKASSAKLSLEGQKNVLAVDAKDAEDYRTQRNASIKQLKALNNMENLLSQGVITGSVQEARTGFLRALDTLGVSTSKARNVVANTEQFDKEVRQLLLGIIKTLGYNPSNADVRFAMDSLPSLTSSAEGLQEIVKRFIKANNDTLAESERALSYFRANNGSFEGFTPNIDIYAPKEITVKDLSDEELQKRLEAARSTRQPK